MPRKPGHPHELTPREIKGVLHAPEMTTGKTVAAMDVLAPGIGEIIGGSPARGAPRCARHAPWPRAAWTATTTAGTATLRR